MTTDQWIVLINAATLAPFAACALVYGLRSPWWTRPIGRALMLLLSSLCAVLLLAIAIRLLHTPDGPTAWTLRVITLGAVQVAGWWLFRLFLRYQRNKNGVRK